MAAVEVTPLAAADLTDLIETHSLPADARSRVARTLEPLARFPRMGKPLTGAWAGYRALVGPWRWMLIVYLVIEEEDRVIVLAIQDARSSSAATAGE